LSVGCSALIACGPSTGGTDSGDDDGDGSIDAGDSTTRDARVDAGARPDAELDPDRPDAGAAIRCGVLQATVRDFNKKDTAGGHTDFQACWGAAPTPGIVQPRLSAARKPVFASTGPHVPSAQFSAVQVASESSFSHWFTDSPGSTWRCRSCSR
jgi:hypothetical protein